jgi:hypothetical protein
MQNASKRGLKHREHVHRSLQPFWDETGNNGFSYRRVYQGPTSGSCDHYATALDFPYRLRLDIDIDNNQLSPRLIIFSQRTQVISHSQPQHLCIAVSTGKPSAFTAAERCHDAGAS